MQGVVTLSLATLTWIDPTAGGARALSQRAVGKNRRPGKY